MFTRVVKKSIRTALRKFGFDIVQIRGEQTIGLDPGLDMQRFLTNCDRPVIFDVGANIGQSVNYFKSKFGNSIIHSFEPSPTTFEELNRNCYSLKGVNTWNLGVGSSDMELEFQENEHSDMSSFLSPGELAWGTVVKKTIVPVVTLDSFTRENGINFIHVLKADTQGFEFEVFKGASELMKQNRIALLYFECIFSEMYKEQPKYYEIFKYLSERNYSLVTFYKSYYQEELISWTDALFINRDFNQHRLTPNG